MKSVAVIGGGISGLVAVKECLQHGLIPTCFEKRKDIGGLWFIEKPSSDDNVSPSEARIYKGMIQNTFKDYIGYSDFAHEKEAPCFMPATEIKSYLEKYCDKFKLKQYIECSTQVKDVRKSEDYDVTGNWTVEYFKVGTQDPPKIRTFNAVMICSGRFSKAIMPSTLPTEPVFKGRIRHSCQVWDPCEFQDKNVVIVGAGISGIDLAEAVAPFANKVSVVSRNGTWVFPINFPGPKYYEDYFFDREFLANTNLDDVRSKIASEVSKIWDLNKMGFNPMGPPLSGKTAFAVSNNINFLVDCGKIESHIGSIAKFEERAVILDTGKRIPVDEIINATGFELELPFINDKNIMPDNIADSDWWLHIYPVHQKHATLFTIGLFYDFGIMPSVAEIQARFTPLIDSLNELRASCGILSGELKLPPVEEMKARIKQEKDAHLFMWQKYPGLVNGPQLSLELSKFVGCYPDVDVIEKIDPLLANEMRNGPLFPAQFRLLGPHSDWENSCKILKERENNRHFSRNNAMINKSDQ